MNDMDNPFLWKEDKINKRIIDTYNNISPLVINRNPIDKFVISLKKEKLDNDLLELARNIEGEIAHNKNHIFKANIQKLESPNIFGANYGRPGTKWAALAEQRFASHE